MQAQDSDARLLWVLTESLQVPSMLGASNSKVGLHMTLLSSINASSVIRCYDQGKRAPQRWFIQRLLKNTQCVFARAT